MSKVIDFYEGAARSAGYENFAALEADHDAMIDAELELLQAACGHVNKHPHSDMCMDCGKLFPR